MFWFAVLCNSLLSASLAVLAGLVDTLNGTGSFTVFAPDNDAFALLDPAVVKGLSVDQVKKILTYHVLPVAASSVDVASGTVSLQTVYGQNLTSFSPSYGQIYVDYAQLRVTRDVQCSNGVIHVIDKPLILAAVVPSTTPATPAPAGGSNIGIIIGAVAGGVVVLGLAVFAYFRCSKKSEDEDMGSAYQTLPGGRR